MDNGTDLGRQLIQKEIDILHKEISDLQKQIDVITDKIYDNYHKANSLYAALEKLNGKDELLHKEDR